MVAVARRTCTATVVLAVVLLAVLALRVGHPADDGPSTIRADGRSHSDFVATCVSGGPGKCWALLRVRHRHRDVARARRALQPAILTRTRGAPVRSILLAIVLPTDVAARPSVTATLPWIRAPPAATV
jgi:hypothetical protein